MKQITQQEVIKIFEEKQQSAEQSLQAIKDIKSKANEQKQLLGEALAYEDCIAFLRGCKIVEEQTNQDFSKMYGKLPISEEITSAQFEACDQPFETIKVRVSGKVVEYGENNIRIMDGVNVYQFPKYAVDRHQELCETASVENGEDLPKLKENTPKNNSDKYIEELLNNNTKLQQELAQCKDTIVELANEVAVYRKVARDRG